MTSLALSWPLLLAGTALLAALGAGLLVQAARLRDCRRALAEAAEQLARQTALLDTQAQAERSLQVALSVEKTRVEQLQRQLDRADAELIDQQALAEARLQQWSDSQREAESWRGQFQQLTVQQTELKQALMELQQAHALLQTRFAELGQTHAGLQSTLAQKEQQFDTQQQLLAQSRDQLKLEFEQLAGRIFEARGQVFAQHSQQSLEALLKPFREQIEGFRSRVEDIHHRDVQQQAALIQELSHLKELNRQITQEAHELATALKGQKKTQGNWGELVLENVLERSGLVLGRDFEREVSFVGAEGRQRPDVIVHLPQGKHLIIDAKVSLNAYTRYVNSEDEGERRRALAEHVQAVGQRIHELAERDYCALPGLNSPEMVFMFVPVESAFVEALRADESLFQRAIERNVLVATPTTLLSSLNIVRQLWRYEDQNRHTAELADKAARVYDKLRTFLGSMDGVGKSLDKAQEAYRRACDQLLHGKGNLVKQVSDFRQLGVAVKGEIEEQWVERAELELGLTGDPDELAARRPFRKG